MTATSLPELLETDQGKLELVVPRFHTVRFEHVTGAMPGLKATDDYVTSDSVQASGLIDDVEWHVHPYEILGASVRGRGTSKILVGFDAWYIEKANEALRREPIYAESLTPEELDEVEADAIAAGLDERARGNRTEGSRVRILPEVSSRDLEELDLQKVRIEGRNIWLGVPPETEVTLHLLDGARLETGNVTRDGTPPTFHVSYGAAVLARLPASFHFYGPDSKPVARSLSPTEVYVEPSFDFPTVACPPGAEVELLRPRLITGGEVEQFDYGSVDRSL